MFHEIQISLEENVLKLIGVATDGCPHSLEKISLVGLTKLNESENA